LLHDRTNIGEGGGGACLALVFLEGLTTSSAFCRALVGDTLVRNAGKSGSSSLTKVGESSIGIATTAAIAH